MSKLLSVSIAAYNVEKTIEECLDSFLPSKYLDELELLVVNDGSHDRTVEIVSAYEKKYPGIVRLINKENGGHGSTINTSLRLATGKFYKVIDGDDWVDAGELDKLMECLHGTRAELVINDYMDVYPDRKHRVSHRKEYKDSFLYQFEELFPDKDYNNDIFAMHETTILAQRLRDVKMKIQEHCFYADTEFIYYVGLAADTVEFNNSCAYQYRLGSAGQSVSPEGVYKHIEDMLKIEYELMSFYHRDFAIIKSETRKHYLFAIIDTRYNMLFSWFMVTIQRTDKDKLFCQFLEKVKNQFPDIVEQCYLPLTYKLVSLNPAFLIPRMRNFKRSGLFNVLHKLKGKIKGQANE